MVLKLGARNSFWEDFFIVVCFSIIFKVFHSRKVTGLFFISKTYACTQYDPNECHAL